MVRLLSQQLRRWRSDTSIAAVVLQAEGEKGFSAGGDVAEVIRQVRAGGSDQYAYGDAFFEEEYILDRLIHHYGKPLIVFSHGVNMGGGMGLSAGASHRIIAQASKVAMPEIHIGLFPDVGGGFFLNRLPPGVGMVMALTGLTIKSGAWFTDSGLGQSSLFAPMCAWLARRCTQPRFNTCPPLSARPRLSRGRSCAFDRQGPQAALAAPSLCRCSRRGD
ncbi:MAG: hypothetical protein EB116_10650 [Betaproteobacteria bacterium]|nr:hypothetical protein [Betaproteobacteria bacterium]